MKDIFVVVKNTFWQVLGKISSVIISLVTITVLTRYLGTSGYGNFNLVFTYLSFFGVLADLGVNLLFVKEYTRTSNPFIITRFLISKLVLVLCSLLLSLVFIPLLPYDASVKTGLFLGAFAVSMGYLNGFGYAILQSRVQLHLVAFYELINRLVTVAILLLVVYLNLGFNYILGSVFLGNTVSLLLAIVTIKGFLPEKLWFFFPDIKKSIVMAIPIGISAIFSTLYFRIDTLILSFYRPPNDVGIYSLAYKIFDNILILWGLYMASFYPLAAKYFQQNEKKQFASLFNQTIIFLTLLSIIVLIGAQVFGTQLITLLAGEKFKLSIIPLKVLSLAVPFFLINNVYYHMLLLSDRTRLILYSMVFSLLFNLILNFIFIPHYGYVGASATTLATEIGLSIVYTLLLTKEKIL